MSTSATSRSAPAKIPQRPTAETYSRKLLSRCAERRVDYIRDAIYEAGLKRIRPCMMTTITTLMALLPVLTSTGRGADVARAMALPVFGGMLVEPFTTFIVQTLYCAYMEFKLRAGFQDEVWVTEDDAFDTDQATVIAVA